MAMKLHHQLFTTARISGNEPTDSDITRSSDNINEIYSQALNENYLHEVRTIGFTDIVFQSFDFFPR